jgi:hypothetical protein
VPATVQNAALPAPLRAVGARFFDGRTARDSAILATMDQDWRPATIPGMAPSLHFHRARRRDPVDHSSYLDLSRPGDPREQTAYFVLDSLLRSRIDCGFESNSARYDEDVNVYVVDMLSSLIRSPGFAAAAGREIDVFERVRDSQDPREKSRVYRANADHLLVSTSLFVDTPYVERGGQRDFDDEARDRIGRGKAYYRWAALFLERARAGSPVFARVLHDLSVDLERWVEVLFHMRGEYFHLYERLRDDQLVALGESRGDEEPTDASVDVLRNEFLDAYWGWHQCPDVASRAILDAAVRRLRSTDPSFRFDLDS